MPVSVTNQAVRDVRVELSLVDQTAYAAIGLIVMRRPESCREPVAIGPAWQTAALKLGIFCGVLSTTDVAAADDRRRWRMAVSPMPCLRLRHRDQSREPLRGAPEGWLPSRQ